MATKPTVVNRGTRRGQSPIATVFICPADRIHRFWTRELWFARPEPGQDMRHVDFTWPMWSIFDCTPEGRGFDCGAAKPNVLAREVSNANDQRSGRCLEAARKGP